MSIKAQTASSHLKPIFAATFPFPFSNNLSRQELWLSTLFVLCCLLAGLCVSALPPIGGSSEAREAHVIQLMAEQHDYILPLRNGIIPSKPPLFHWFGLAVAELTGEFVPLTARVPSLLSAALILWLVMSLAAELGGIDQERRLRFMAWAGIILATSYEFEKMRTVAMVDMVFAAFVMLAVAPFIFRLLIVSRRSGGESSAHFTPANYNAFFLFSGIAVLAKGPIGIILPVVLLAPLLAAQLGWRGATRELFRPRFGWLFFLLIALPWYLLAALRQSHAFLGRQIIFENLNRFTGGKNVNQQPFWFYIPAFLRASLPWSLFFLAGTRVWFNKQSQQDRTLVHLPVDLIRALYLSIALGVVFFSLSSGKRDSYLLPLLPLLALATAPTVIGWLDSRSPRTRYRIEVALPLLAQSFAVLLLVALGFIECTRALNWAPSQPLLNFFQVWVAEDLPLAGFVAGAAVLVLPLARRCQWGAAAMATGRALVMLLSFSTAMAIGLSFRNRLKNFEPVAQQINQQVGGASLQVVRELRDEFFDGILYYLRREVSLVDPADITSQCSGFALLRYDQWLKLKSEGRLITAETAAIYTEIDDQIRGRDSNQKILVRCLQ